MNIKDYLHFYLGCNVWTPHGISRLTTVGLLGNDSQRFRVLFDPMSVEDLWEPEYKPILRLLSDITEEENKEASSLYFNLLEKQQKKTRDIIMMAHMTKWYLSKHFDLFNLIETGLAIDKTKQ